MIKNILAASVLALSLSACVVHENHHVKHPDRHGHDRHDYKHHDKHWREYDGYPYDRRHCPPGHAKKGWC